jgi:hypothetical protein
MLLITTVLGSYEFRLCLCLGAQGGSQISGRREDSAGGSAVLSMLSEDFENELSNSEAENMMMKGDYVRHVIEAVIGGVPTILEICFMCLFRSLGRILLVSLVSMNLFHLVRYLVDLRNVEVGMCFLVYLSDVHMLCSQSIRSGVRLLAGSPE